MCPKIIRLRGVSFIVRAGGDIIKAEFIHTKRTNCLTKMKYGIHLEELKQCIEIVTFLLSEYSPVRKATMSENSDLYRMNWRKCYFDAFSCYRTRYKFIWRDGEHSYHKL